MKAWKRNAATAAVLVFVCAGIWLNWIYGRTRPVDLTSTLNEEKLMDDGALVLQTDDGSVEALAGEQQKPEPEPGGADAFARMRLSRQESRDSAVHLLQETIAYAGENEDISAGTAQLNAIVNMALAEASVESLVISKGYTDCVAYMQEDGISLAVAAPEGLQQTDVAVLTDIVLSQTDYDLPQIRIIEVK